MKMKKEEEKKQLKIKRNVNAFQEIFLEILKSNPVFQQ
jgi:hypothetical protein